VISTAVEPFERNGSSMEQGTLQPPRNTKGPGSAGRARVLTLPLVGVVSVAILVPLAVLLRADQRSSNEDRSVAEVPDIRSIDFDELTYPAAAIGCFSGPLAVDPHPDSVAVTGGAAFDPLTGSTVEVRDVVVADIDRDGRDDALVAVGCDAGASLSVDAVSVFSSTPAGPRLVGTVPAPGTDLIGGFEPRVLLFSTVADGEVRVVWQRWEDGEAHCCPSGQAAVRYRWDGSALAPVGEAETGPLAQPV
jgi:hypothetical protein